jgi:hypothetical protein
MTFKHARLALLMLTLYCAACGPTAAQAHPSPTADRSFQPEAGSPTAPTPTGTATSTAFPPAPTLTAARVFTETFDAKPPYWAFLQVDNGQSFPSPSIRDGFLVFDLLATNQWGYALYGGHAYVDVLIETQAQSRTAGDGAVGLVCRYDENKGWYEFNMFADGTYQLLFGQWLAPGVARYTPLYQAQSRAIHSDVNELGLECEGNLLQPFINGAALRKWPELNFGLKNGEVGLSASSFADAPYTVAFDWARVSEP